MSLLFTLPLGHFFKNRSKQHKKLLRATYMLHHCILHFFGSSKQQTKNVRYNKKTSNPFTIPLLKKIFKKNVMSFNDVSPFLNAIFLAPKKKKKHRNPESPPQVLAHGCIGSASGRGFESDKGDTSKVVLICKSLKLGCCISIFIWVIYRRCLGYIGDEILPIYVGMRINHHKNLY